MLCKVSSMFSLRPLQMLFLQVNDTLYGTAKIMIYIEVVVCQFLHSTIFHVEVKQHICFFLRISSYIEMDMNNVH